jgi:MFS family permease
VAFGLLSIFLPLYVVNIGGSLLDVGLMISTATFLAIPASFLWGYVCDKTGRYKRYILISFLATSCLLCLFTLTKEIGLFIILYGIMAIFHMAHEPPKNVLIAELYAREEWEKSFAIYEWFTELGWLVGLIVGVFISFVGFDPKTTFYICSGLNFLAFILSLLFVHDPPLILERRLVRLEKYANFVFKGATIALRALDGFSAPESLTEENLTLFCGGLTLFAFATSTLFTPLPVFLVQNLCLSIGMVYMIYVLNSSASMIGYFLASKKLETFNVKTRLQKVVLFRSGLVFVLATLTFLNVQGVIAFAFILFLMGFAYALYHIFALSLSMELIPAGKAGLFDALVGLGSASGAYLGSFIAQALSFTCTFILSGITFLLAYIFFKAY